MGAQDRRLPKSEMVLKGNLQSLYTVIISLCDTEVKNQIMMQPNES